MKNTIDAFRLQLAWDLTQQSRCCPPDDILFSEVTSEALERHVSDCSLCKKRLERGPEDGLETLARILRNGDASQPEIPTPGQVWTVRSELGGFGPGSRYYAAPCVFIIDILSNEYVRVCQISGFKEFMRDDDVSLRGRMEGFVQPWNSYPLRASDLCRSLDTEDEATLDAVLAAVEADEDRELPAVVHVFRHMELETGLYFAYNAAVEMADEGDADESAPLPGTVLAFKPSIQTRPLTPVSSSNVYALAAASSHLAFESEDGTVVCHAEISDDGSVLITNQTTGDRTLEVWFRDEESDAVILMETPDGGYAPSLVVESCIEARIRLHPDADLGRPIRLEAGVLA